MPLYIRDEDVNQLAKKVQKAIGAPTKTDAVRTALNKLLEEQVRQVPFSERLKLHQEKTAALGKPNPDFDEKAYTNEMWGGI